MRGDGEAGHIVCRHCWHVGPPGADHSCPCPFADESCPSHRPEAHA